MPAVLGRTARWVPPALVVAAMVLPTAAAWVYFAALAGSPLARPVYLGAKAVQFSLPLLWWFGWRRGPPRPGSAGRGWKLAARGAASGVVLAGAIAVSYAVLLAGSPLGHEAAARIREALADFRVVGPGHYLAMAASLAVAHSLLEEVYWRAFVYGRLAVWLPAPAAVALASLAFAAHHLIVVARYVPADRLWSVAVPATAAVALAGAHWCALYRRTGSLLAPWVSHLLVDAAVLGLGYLLLLESPRSDTPVTIPLSTEEQAP
jgi:membrane protease YdiL (CAAX protease family)